MPKNLKLNINELKVQSFVTALNDEEKNKFKGGGSGKCDDTQSQVATCAVTCSCGSVCLTCTPSWCSGNSVCC